MKKILTRWLERQRKKKDEACEEACIEAYIEIWRDTLRPGDKVWVFEGWEQKIKEKTIKTIIYEDGREIIVCKGLPFPYAFGRDAFPTRESLCEHYKKIFEF